MKKKLFTIVLAGAFLMMVTMPTLSLAGKGRMGSGQRIQTQTRSGLMTQTRTQTGQMTQTQTQAGEAQKKGNTYGPGDGTGNMGDRPQDGTGYGAPDNR
ncbi:MAG: hypothetical protein JXA41_02985 [Deltaproteobacteria bacterium]|nr:hypothetical protein [Deltaproteobacteria bacterium]